MNRHIIAFIGLSALFSACSTNPIRMAANQRIPAAQGELKLGEGENNNTTIALDVKHLAPPSRMDPAATTYVVWLRPAPQGRVPATQQKAQNIGALQVNSDLNGALKVQTAFRNFQIFITAEPSASMTAPTGEVLLWTEVNK